MQELFAKHKEFITKTVIVLVILSVFYVAFEILEEIFDFIF